MHVSMIMVVHTGGNMATDMLYRHIHGNTLSHTCYVCGSVLPGPTLISLEKVS